MLKAEIILPPLGIRHLVVWSTCAFDNQHQYLFHVPEQKIGPLQRD